MDIATVLTHINEHLATIVAILVPLEALTLVLLLIFAWRSGRQARRIAGLLKTEENGSNLERLIRDFLDEAKQAGEERGELFKQLTALRETLRPTIQHIGFVRYNAFPGVGGELSFSIALLDGRSDGLVLTSIFGREEARVYAKQIKAGQSQSVLSEEEQSAVAQALRQG